jgi:hypothetical protein
MPHTVSLPEAVAELCNSLDEAQQPSLLEYAQFLKAQEGQRSSGVVDDLDEEEWDRQISDPANVAKLARWADASLAREKPRPIDPGACEIVGQC